VHYNCALDWYYWIVKLVPLDSFPPKHTFRHQNQVNSSIWPTSTGPYANNLHLATTPTPHHSIFTGQMLFVMPNQQCQSTEEQEHYTKNWGESTKGFCQTVPKSGQNALLFITTPMHCCMDFDHFWNTNVNQYPVRVHTSMKRVHTSMKQFCIQDFVRTKNVKIWVILRGCTISGNSNHFRG